MNTVSSEAAVKERYASAAEAPEAALCCPVDYDARYLKIIPQEVIDKDYGCGDPSRHLKPGETVLDLGSGTGKICFIAAQIVGPQGRVIGVDMTDEMLEVARRNAPIVAERLGYSNVEFRKGRIQDLALDLERLDEALKERPIKDAASFLAAHELAEEIRQKQPLVPSDSVDVVVSNCVLNLVEQKSKNTLFSELFRVLRAGGRAVISDIVSDKCVPPALRNDPQLWSGCISGALTEQEFLQAFIDAGFYGIQVLKREERPWRTVEGIEFRSVTVEAFKDKPEANTERKHTVIYMGPFKEVTDDENQRFERGDRHLVSDRTAQRLLKDPYKGYFAAVDSRADLRLENMKPILDVGTLRNPAIGPKAAMHKSAARSTECCDGSTCC